MVYRDYIDMIGKGVQKMLLMNSNRMARYDASLQGTTGVLLTKFRVRSRMLAAILIGEG